VIQRVSRPSRGQTILELIGVTSALVLFFGLSYYLAAVFSVAHQQTMLNRTQAFIELGNYSYYGFSKHGEDDPKEEKSRVVFFMGKKSAGTTVNFDDQKDFKEATEGELAVDIFDGPEEAVYWRKFSFPKSITDVNWMGQYETPMFQIRLFSVLAIAHNRSLNLSASRPPSSFNNETGLYSGSMHFNQYSQVASLARKMGFGMVDNVDLIKELLRDLVRNDPSLAEEAAELERNLNLSESITGGGVSSLISLAISAAAWGLQSLAASASAAGSGAQAAGSEGVGKAISTGAKVVDGSFGEAVINTVTAPFRAAGDAFANFSVGFSGALGSSATWGHLWQGMYGASQMGQLTQMGLSAAGQSSQGLNIAVSALAMPYGVNQGLQSFESAMNNKNLAGVIQPDWAGAIQSIPKIVSPVTNFLVQVAPDSALPISYLNAGLSAASALSSLPGNVGELSSGSLKTLDTIIKVGEITAGVGTLVSNVAYLAGEDQKIGGYLQMAGGGLAAIGFAGKTLEELKLEDFTLENLVSLPGDIVQKNIDGAKNALDQFGKDMARAGEQIENAWADLLGPKVAVDSAGFLPGAKDLIDKSTGIFSDDRITGDSSRIDLLKTEAVLTKLEDNLQLQMAAYGKADDGTMAAEFRDAREAVGVLRQMRGGVEQTSEMKAVLDKGASAIASLNAKVDQHFKTELAGNYLAKSQLIGSMYGNNQRAIAENLVGYGMTFKEGHAIEAEYRDSKPFAHFMESFNGGRMTDRLIQQQIDAAEDLVIQVSKSKEEIPKDFKGDRNKLAVEIRNRAAVEILSRAEVISPSGPISTDNVDRLKQGAGESAQILRTYRDDPALKHNDNMRIRLNSAIDKLEGLSSGRIAVDTGRRTIQHIAQQLAEREARFQRIKSTLLKCNAGLC
jgi:hypothetical protein